MMRPSPLFAIVSLALTLATADARTGRGHELTSPAIAAPPGSVISAGNVPFAGISPGGVVMATGELILVLRGSGRPVPARPPALLRVHARP